MKKNVRLDGSIQPPNEQSTHQTVIDFYNDALNVKPRITINDIDNSHRLKQLDNNSDRPPTIIVKFQSSKVKRRVYNARFRLKAINQKRSAARRIADEAGSDDAASDTSDAEHHEEGDAARVPTLVVTDPLMMERMVRAVPILPD